MWSLEKLYDTYELGVPTFVEVIPICYLVDVNQFVKQWRNHMGIICNPLGNLERF